MARTLIKNIVGEEGREVEISGWVDNRRDHGKILFLDLSLRIFLFRTTFLSMYFFSRFCVSQAYTSLLF